MLQGEATRISRPTHEAGLASLRLGQPFSQAIAIRDTARSHHQLGLLLHLPDDQSAATLHVCKVQQPRTTAPQIRCQGKQTRCLRFQRSTHLQEKIIFELGRSTAARGAPSGIQVSAISHHNSASNNAGGEKGTKRYPVPRSKSIISNGWQTFNLPSSPPLHPP